jgi:hypothetical protein
VAHSVGPEFKFQHRKKKFHVNMLLVSKEKKQLKTTEEHSSKSGNLMIIPQDIART